MTNSVLPKPLNDLLNLLLNRASNNKQGSFTLIALIPLRYINKTRFYGDTFFRYVEKLA